jgi:hypothetical protein
MKKNFMIVGCALISVGIGTYLYAQYSKTREVVFSEPIRDHPQPLYAQAFIPHKGTYSLLLRFDGRPEVLGMQAENHYFQREITYPLHVKVTTSDDSILVDTNHAVLRKAQYGTDVVCYSIAFLQIDHRAKLLLSVTPSVTDIESRPAPARIEIHQSPILVRNAAIKSFVLKAVSVVVCVIGLQVAMIGLLEPSRRKA